MRCPDTPRENRRPASARIDRPEEVPPLNDIQDDSSVKMGRVPRSFIKENALAVIRPHIKRAPSASSLRELQHKMNDDLKNYHRGEVPEYLVERKKQWKAEEEDRIRNLPDPVGFHF